MDGDDLELFERSLRQATDAHTGDDLDGALVDLGWPDALADDDARRGVGALRAPGRGQRHVLRARPAARPRDRRRPGDGLAVGPSRWRIRRRAPGPRRRGALREGRSPAGASSSTGSAPPRLAGATPRSSSPATATRRSPLAVPAGELTVRPVEGIDPWLGLVEVTGDIAVDRPVTTPVTGWAAAVALGQLASATSSSARRGRCSPWPASTPSTASSSGKPISSFQAVRHRLAETLVAIETAEACSTRPGRTGAADRGHGEGARRTGRPHRLATLPAGARRHRLHHRAPAAPLRPAGPRARRAVRLRPVPHPLARRGVVRSGTLPALLPL